MSISLSKPCIQRKKPFYKILKNSQIGAEKLGKTADFVISLIFFFTLMLLDRMFFNIFWIRLCMTNLLIPISTYLEKIKQNKNTCITGFSATNSHLRWSVFILSKNAFRKCCLKIKKRAVVFTVVVTTFGLRFSQPPGDTSSLGMGRGLFKSAHPTAVKGLRGAFTIHNVDVVPFQKPMLLNKQR